MPEIYTTLRSSVLCKETDVDVDPCLSDHDILAYAQGKIPSHRFEKRHMHADTYSVFQRPLGEETQALEQEPCTESARPTWNTVFEANSLVAKRYRIIRLVARGGMGEVYEADDTALHERVAIKTVTSTACDSARAVRALKAEVLHARRITHPNVCRIFDFGTHAMETSGGEVHFLVMEFVEGDCLGKTLRSSGALPIDVAVSIARQLLLGLHAAHCAGILHRDFKSENVITRTTFDGQIHATILDFGLAKVLNENGCITTTQTQGTEMVGTVSYMAPEQIEGAPLSRASDLYALGVVWFEMLTGRLPFEAASPAASALARLHRSAEAPSSINPAVPEWLDDLVLRCLSRERSERFGTAQQVLDALSSATSKTPVGASPNVAATSAVLHWGWSAAFVVLTGYGLVDLHLSRRPSALAENWSTAAFRVFDPKVPEPPRALATDIRRWSREYAKKSERRARPPRQQGQPVRR